MSIDLISDGEWLEFREVIGDVFQTFANTNVILRKRTTKLSAVNQGRSDSNSFEDVNLKAVYIQISSATDAQVVVSTKGSLERTESYLLIDYKVFNDAGLLNDNGENTINAGKDSIIIRDIEYDILGVNQVGPLDAGSGEEGIEAAIKIHLQKPVRPNHSA